MTRYFAQNTPRAGLEHMMMSVPGFQKRGGGMMILSRFCYKPEDVDCRYCLHYRRRSCQVRTCPYIAERLKSGAIEYLDLILEYFGHIPHAGLHKRIQAVEHWSGPDQAVLHTVSVHLRSRFADRVWDDAPPGYLAALYLLASKERLWQPALSALSHDSIDFSRIVSKPHGFAIQDYPIFYSARRLYDLKSPMEAEDLAHPKLVSDLDFHNIIYATMIARYGKAVMDAQIKAITSYQFIIADKAKTEHPLLILRRRYQKEDHVPTQVITLIVVGAIMFLVIGGLAFLSHYYTLDGIKSKTVGDGQHGTARWATKQEIRQTYAHVPFEPELWRKGEHLPEKQGLVLGCEGPKDHVTALVDTDDIHAMVTAASGAGKTAFFLYPNIEYALASGMSFLCTDTKGDLFRNYAGIAKDCYGYQIAVLDLRNPTRSDGNNLLHLINKYMDIYKADPKNLAAKAKAEKYSKILAKTLINTSGGDSAQYGQNAFFYDSAEGLLTAMFLLVAEYLPTEDADGNPIEKRHIVSVFKLVQELLAPSRVKGKNQFQLLLEKLPPNHKARWFAGSALNTAEQAMASVISTVLSRLNAFLDSEMEQILCFDTAIDAEKFCNEKSAIFIVLPEEDQTKYFMVSLILQNLYREILTVADENGGRLKNRVVFFADELGTCPPIQSLELMFSASRSRGLMLVPIVQSITGQLQKNYGKEGSEIIVDNCQVNLYGGFAPASQTAVELSKSLGSRTVMSGSISRGKNDPSQSLQMMERPLMTPDELKSMPKGSFIVAKTGVHPMKVKLRLFLDWGIRFGKPYEVPEKAQRFVAYADKQELEESIIRRHYGTIVMDSEQPQGGGTSAGGMAQGIQAAPDSRKTVFRP